MKHKLTTSFLCTILYFTAAVCAQSPAYQHITCVEVPLVEIDVQETNTLRHVDRKIHQVFQDIDAKCAKNLDPFELVSSFGQKYHNDIKHYMVYTGLEKWEAAGSQSGVYPLESYPDYFMNYSVQKVPAEYDMYTASFNTNQTIHKLIFNFYSKNQIKAFQTPPRSSTVKDNQQSLPKITKTVYIGLPQPLSLLDMRKTAKIEKEKKLSAWRNRVQKTRSKRNVIFGLAFLLFIVFFVVLLIIGIVVAVSSVNKEKKEQTRISLEVLKINAMASTGKISPDEADELKLAFGPVAFTETSREPDTHIKVIGILNIVLPAIHGLLLIILFLGLGTFMTFNSGPHSGPLLILVIILVLGLILLAFTIFHVIAAIALMKGRSWGRIVIVVFAVLGITSVPIGTALGIYALWALIFREDAGLYFISDNKQ